MITAPEPSSPGVSVRMRRQLRAATKPELDLRQLLHARGYRYRVGFPVPGAPRRSIDIAFTKRRVAVFLDGCFWHGCPEHGTLPRANGPWWSEKLEKNRARDADTDQLLHAAGWKVVRVWEHEDTEEALHRVVRALADAAGTASLPGDMPCGQ